MQLFPVSSRILPMNNHQIDLKEQEDKLVVQVFEDLKTHGTSASDPSDPKTGQNHSPH